MNVQLLVFAVLAVTSVATALAMIFARNAVHGVLFMVGNFAAVALLYVLLGSPFLAAVQILVYAGAIMVLFLFVVMLMGPEPAPLWEHIPGQRPFALLFGLLLAAGLIVAVNVEKLTGVPGMMTQEVLERLGQPTALAQTLFERYVLPFEVTSLLLLIGMIGAVVLAKREKHELPAEQASREGGTE
ncbi:MAG: NADH-quinone oxidoreductase subunit J [Ardenticatenia bacterium]|nr:NADH-quinone oxidoreductase subunit J [Ardenticatenia bacterium]